MRKIIITLIGIYTILLCYKTVSAESDIQKVILDNLYNYESDTFVTTSSDISNINNIWNNDEILNYLVSVNYTVYKNTTTLKLNRLLSKEQNDFIDTEIGKISVKTLQETNNYIKAMYSYDYTLKRLNYTLYGMIQSREGICTSYSYMFDRLAKKIGYESRTIKGKTSAGHHLWNQVKIGDTWLNIDVTWNDNIGWDKYFLVTNEFLKKEGRIFKED